MSTRFMAKRESIKALVESGDMPRATADKLVAIDRPDDAKLEVNGTEIALYDAIDSWGGMWGVSGEEFKKALAKVDEDAERITVRLNSPGGEVFEGLAIHNLLVEHSADVEVVVDGYAASIASIVAMAGDKITMGRGAQMMIHRASMGGRGTGPDMIRQGEWLTRIDNMMADVYSARAGGDKADWLEAMDAETWYIGGEAVEAGLATDSAPLKTGDDAPVEALWSPEMFSKIETPATPDFGLVESATADSDDAERQAARVSEAKARLAGLGVVLG